MPMFMPLLEIPRASHDRRLALHPSAWARSFACEDVRPLIVCRGPIRLEAYEVFGEMGMTQVGILLSERDSVVYSQAQAPELRVVPPHRVHRVADYSGATKEERLARIAEIIAIARTHGYNAVFAGYGFMAEDDGFVAAIEGAGIRFLGPCSYTVRAAGLKDEAKRTAIAEGVSVTPGISNVTARVLLAKYPTREMLRNVVASHALTLADEVLGDDSRSLAEVAGAVLWAGYARGVDLLSLDEVVDGVALAAAELLAAHPGSRFRLKAIGGGGGKGQRILAACAPEGDEPLVERARKAAAPAAALAREVLSEVKATGVGDNRNILVELNIEETRHLEIQLIGNGEWSMALGGRDCSLQMHEQKLLEVSVTAEEMAREAQRADPIAAVAIEEDREVLLRMEAESERFARSVKLDSVSTFECIVDRGRHYFMEVNTRIQVEHRVTELCYTLRFHNPNDPSEMFEVDSLVEAMALLSRHGTRMPRPERVPRYAASVEARLNATDAALAPHAGGVVVSWTDPLPHEIRDDQGIGRKNPDTNAFMRYRLAGAYDSNIALIVTPGLSRKDAYERLAESLRHMRIRGNDLNTNHTFHRGLLHWFLARGVMAKATTQFVAAYLAQVGLLQEVLQEVDLSALWTARRNTLAEGAGAAHAVATRAAMDRQVTLVLRPLELLLADPHLASAWISGHRDAFDVRDGRVVWLQNPLDVLADSYEFLRMDAGADDIPAWVIWDHDAALLSAGRDFYRDVSAHTGALAWPALDALLQQDAAPDGWAGPSWERVRASHGGFQLAAPLMGMLALAGDASAFERLGVREDLTLHIPDVLLDPALQRRMRTVLAPPLVGRANEIVSVSGGMYYAQEAPGRPHFVLVGDHVEAGEPLYVIEVMKMFNKVVASFPCTIDAILIGTNGTIVQKGQPLFRVTPDVAIAVDDREADRARRMARTAMLHRGLSP